MSMGDSSSLKVIAVLEDLENAEKVFLDEINNPNFTETQQIFYLDSQENLEKFTSQING